MFDLIIAGADKALAFAMRVMAIPELHALALATVVAFALTYGLSLGLPATLLVTTARRWIRAILVGLVVGIATFEIPTPRMFAWAASYGVFLPLLYEAIFHRIHEKWPWLKPKALMTFYELEARRNSSDIPTSPP